MACYTLYIKILSKKKTSNLPANGSRFLFAVENSFQMGWDGEIGMGHPVNLFQSWKDD